jgi:hypothetical protein
MTLDEWCALDAPQQQVQFYLELKAWWLEQQAKGKAPRVGWIAMKYSARFGQFPSRAMERMPPASEISEHVRAWIRDQQTSFHKERRRKLAFATGSQPVNTMNLQSVGDASEDGSDRAGSA